jgi:hypothetical protein
MPYLQGVKQSHYRPGQALRVLVSCCFQISRQSAHESGNVLSRTRRPPLPSGNIPGTNFCKRLSQPHGHSEEERITSMKKSNYTIAIFLLVAQCLNHLRHRVPLFPRGETTLFYKYFSNHNDLYEIINQRLYKLVSLGAAVG